MNKENDGFQTNNVYRRHPAVIDSRYSYVWCWLAISSISTLSFSLDNNPKRKNRPPQKPIIKEKPALPKHSNEDKEKCEVISVPHIEKDVTTKEQHDRSDEPEEIDMNPIYLSKVLKYVFYLETNSDFISQEFSSSFIVKMDNIEYESMDDTNSE